MSDVNKTETTAPAVGCASGCSADFALEIAGDVIRWMVARDPLKAAAFAIGEYSLADAIRKSIDRLKGAESIRLQAESDARQASWNRAATDILADISEPNVSGKACREKPESEAS